MNKLILYHANCIDGYVAAAWLYMYFKIKGTLQQVVFLPISYGDPIPDCTGKEVYIVDFSVDPETAKQIASVASKVVCLDHHVSALNTYLAEHHAPGLFESSSFCKNGNVYSFLDGAVIFDMSRSGAGMARDYVMELLQAEDYFNDPSPDQYSDAVLRLDWVTDRVQDRDLWQFKLPETKATHQVLIGLGYLFHELLVLLQCSEELFREKLNKAQSRVDMHDELSASFAADATSITLGGIRMPAVNVPYAFASRVGEILNQEHPCSLTYCIKGNKVHCSLRSKAGGVDVSNIASNFGGGGHQAAAGFNITLEALAAAYAQR